MDKVLMLQFLDEDNKEHTITINNPKEDLTKAQITTAMQTIIDKDAMRTKAGKRYAEISNAYYRTVTIEYPTDPGGGE